MDQHLSPRSRRPHGLPASPKAASESRSPRQSTGESPEAAGYGSNQERHKLETRAILTAGADSRRTFLDQDVVEGYLVMHVKKPKKKLFQRTRSFYVVGDANKPVLKVFNNETRSRELYLLSLASAELKFESNDANMVMAKCFCVEVKTWKKKSDVFFKQQDFVFYEEDQVRMLLWVKCIHRAIKNATLAHNDRDIFRASVASTFSDSAPVSDDDCSPETEEARDSTDSNSTPAATAFADEIAEECRAAVLERLSIDTSAVAVSAAAKGGEPSAAKEPRSPFDRINSMLSTPKRLSMNGRSNTAAPGELEADVLRASACAAGRERTGTFTFSPRIKQMARNAFPGRNASGSSKPPRGISHKRGFSAGAFVFNKPEELAATDSSTNGLSDPSLKGRRTTESTISPPEREEVDAPRTDSPRPSTEPVPAAEASIERALPETNPIPGPQPSPVHIHRLLLLSVAMVAGVLEGSLFLPIAVAGLVTHICDQNRDEYIWSLLAALWVYLASRFQGSLGLSSMFAILYAWSFADFKVRKRELRNRRNALPATTVDLVGLTHANVPNWLRHPDIDRVDWLNNVLANGWPYMKVAIKNSILWSLNPLLDAQRPVFMSELSIAQLDLGNCTPIICGVKFVDAKAQSDEVTLDVEVRILTNETFVAELKLVSNLGATAMVSIRDLFLVGTLRVTLNPLCVDWPCFSSISLSFTNWPAFEFSLVAAKINIANVPFASEWLHSFLRDKLLGYIVWPAVVRIPLWDEEVSPGSASSESSSA